MSVLIAESLATLANAKRAIGIASTDTANDTLIEDTLNAATQWIQEQCNRKFGRRNYNDTSTAHAITGIGGEARYKFSGDGRSMTHVLPQYPVDSASITIEELSSRATDGTETWSSSGLVTGYDYVVEWDKGIIRLLNHSFYAGILNYRVTYEAGYEEPAAPSTPAAPWVPFDLQRCCIEVTKQMYKGDGSRITSERIGSWSRSFAEKQNPIIEQTIGKYKSFSNMI